MDYEAGILFECFVFGPDLGDVLGFEDRVWLDLVSPTVESNDKRVLFSALELSIRIEPEWQSVVRQRLFLVDPFALRKVGVGARYFARGFFQRFGGDAVR